jgi:hypothetical protein
MGDTAVAAQKVIISEGNRSNPHGRAFAVKVRFYQYYWTVTNKMPIKAG